MENNALDQLRRHRRFAIPLHLDPVVEALEKRLTPEQLLSIQSVASASAARASSAAAASRSATTTRAGAGNALASTTTQSTVSSFSAAPSYTVGQPLAATPSSSSSAITTTSSALPSSTSTLSSTSTIPSSSAVTPSSISTTPSATLPAVITRTMTTPIASISDALSSASAAASNNSTSSSSMSTGAVVGVVLAVLVGVVILGSFLGWLYRKFSSRGYKSDSRWRKLDEDITPFSTEKDEGYNDDIYGAGVGPVIGSRRALADHTRDGTYPASRPMTDYSNNRAGFGAGMDMYGGAPVDMDYPAHAATYGVDAQGRPYNGQAGRVPSQMPYADEYDYSVDRQSPPAHASSRQLVGPGYSPPQLVPVALGRPTPPRSYSDIAHREDFADEPMSAGMPYEPQTARTNEWAGTAHPGAAPQYEARRTSGATSSGSKSPSPPKPPMALPTFAPLSPIDSSFDLYSQSQPLAVYENEPARQKQLYGEVSAFAGFPEPKTPHSAGLDNTVSSQGTFASETTHSSFSATEYGVRLPAQSSVPPVPVIPQLNVPAPQYSQPYEHGRPLSPLVEVSTPSSFHSAVPGGRELNPYDHLPAPRSLVGPPSAASTGGSSFPSPRFPPPSPGGQSVPGSVGPDSPRRWSGQGTGNVGMTRRSRGESMFDGDDAYGGI